MTYFQLFANLGFALYSQRLIAQNQNDKEKQSKLVAILALCVSVVGLTLGFAAFSNTLTISSSATVSPNESDFNINVYGISDFKGDTYAGTNSLPPIELYTSETTSVANKSSSINPALASSDSKITDNGKSITITDINVGLTEPGQQVSYYYLIKNEGEYDAYLRAINFLNETNTRGTKRKAVVDTVAAEIILQNYLDFKKKG